MSSLRRILSSRRNGRLSHGPKTPEGKAVSSKNGTSHGLYSKTIVLSNESAERYDELLQSLVDEFDPQTPAEHQCVVQMSAASWRLERTWAIETALLDHRLDATSLEHPDCRQVTRLALAFEDLHENGRTIAALGTHQGRLQREYDRAYRRLCHLQESRSQETEPENSQNHESEPKSPPPVAPDPPTHPSHPPISPFASECEPGRHD